MFNCERCGASLPPDRDQCAYCGTVHAQAHALLQAETAKRAKQQAQADAQSAVARQMMLSTTEQAASRALMFGLLSIPFFCLPVFNVLAFLAYKKSQSSAREAGLPVPTRATAGLVCAAIMGVIFFVTWIALIVSVHQDNVRAEARKAELTQQIAAHPASPVLDHPLACQLAELYLMGSGYDGATNTGAFREVTCAGALRVVKDRAEMADFSFQVSGNGGTKTGTVCFKHGERWFVETMRATGCDLDAPALSAPPAPSASAHPAL